VNIPPLPHVECALLHDSFAPIDGQELFNLVQALAAKFGYGAQCQLIVSSTHKDIHVFVGDHRILISQNERPLAPDGFQTALSTPFTSMVFPNARDVVMRHAANTFITVGKGPAPIPDDLMRADATGTIAKISAFTTSQEALRAINLCQSLTAYVAGRHAASAVHWCVSDNLVPPAFFEKAVQSGDVTLLNIRPFLTSSSGRLGPGLPIGVTANGSQWLLGKVVMVEEATVPLEWVLTMLYGFVHVCLQRGALLEHNHSFSVEGQDWQVGVFHEKIEDFDGWEMLRLKIMHLPEYGIHGKVPAKRTISYKSVEDLKHQAAVERAASPANATSVAQLRAMARSSAANTSGSASQSGRQHGLGGRLRSLFGAKPH
jgi:hypothetical protein